MSAAYARSIAGLGHGAPPARGRRAPRRVAAVAEAGPTPEAVEAAYTACEASTRASSATFHFATLLMRPTQRRSVQAIYAWCRELDETVDGVEALRAPKEDADRKLSAIEADLRAMFDDDDRGGVHTNSGIITRALVLLSDGGTHNGETVPALGRRNVLRLCYVAVASELLAREATFLDFRDTLTLIGKVHGVFDRDRPHVYFPGRTVGEVSDAIAAAFAAVGVK